MFAGTTMLTLFVLVSPFNSKYSFKAVAAHAVTKSFIVHFYSFEAALISANIKSLDVAAFLLPVSYLLPSCKGLRSYVSLAILIKTKGTLNRNESLIINLPKKETFLIAISLVVSN